LSAGPASPGGKDPILEEQAGPGHPHGDQVARSIVLMERALGLGERRLAAAFVDARVPRDLASDPWAKALLVQLPDYCRRHALPWSRAHDLAAAKYTPR